ncbi:hypothetical protein RH831_09515 [Halodesulfurarchaeum sp. HSR-GB]|uniref:hypothetical protein n=1 Tax=Halodesulfurarchaeum sp. HSR-GB TaxID=3074077 RepID=UPI002856E1D4|nr:hypothetical protein [Halodesulfurarchaeum sp. HSR-GB]MDR5657417.1 hypothetical protein [Halodesulfurarchaeum sp. HSR-GB]
MIQRVTRFATLTAYQSSLAVGIGLMPIALLARKLGVTLPVHRLVERTEAAYEAKTK